jgi:hypothetical protein
VSTVDESTGADRGLTLKYLSVVYGVGGLHDKGFNEGALVVDKRFAITDKKTSVPVIVLGVVSYWKDWLTQADFSAGKKSNRYATEAQALAAGKSTTWTDDPTGAIDPIKGRVKRVPPSAAKAYDLKVLVRRPPVLRNAQGEEDNDDSLFFLPIGEHFYCPATITFEKTSKEKFEQTLQACQIMAAHEQGLMKTPHKATLHKWLFTLGTEILPATGTRKASTIPVLKRMMNDQKKGASLSAEEVTALEDLLVALTSARAETTEVADDANP